jgi:hypothetical protein
MGKDYKHKDLGKAKRGVIKWNEVSEGTKKMIDRENFDIGEFREEKEKKRDKASRKDMKRQLKDYEEEKEEDD